MLFHTVLQCTILGIRKFIDIKKVIHHLSSKDQHMPIWVTRRSTNVEHSLKKSAVFRSCNRFTIVMSYKFKRIRNNDADYSTCCVSPNCLYKGYLPEICIFIRLIVGLFVYLVFCLIFYIFNRGIGIFCIIKLCINMPI